ncbi:MAG: aldo/keto reductase [Chloroflexota bacterium]|nr:aldo/keto reductase [Chloroflexota bacterium]
MEYRQLGRSGLQVSAVGLGTNNFGTLIDAEQTAKVLHQALDVGINFIDTANVYTGGRSEEFIGKVLKEHRHRVLLATKVGMVTGEGPNQGGASRKNIMEQVEVSLRRLQTDYIDLYQIHRSDPNTPIGETLRALDDLVHQGKVRYIGCSNFAAWQICEAIWTSRALNLAPFISVQPEYSLVTRDIEQDLVPFCRAYQIGIIPYAPLAKGILTGKYRPGEPLPEGTRLARGEARFRSRNVTEANFALVSKLERFAAEHGHSMGELAFAWLLANPLVGSVIAGASKPEQVVANSKAADWHLTPQEMTAINGLLA